MSKLKEASIGGQGSFFINVVNDKNNTNGHVYITLGIPKIVDVPYVGPTTLESICLAAATCLLPCLFWLSKRTVRRLQQFVIKEEKRIEDDTETESIETKQEPPIKAKQWEVVKNGKLDEFINNEIVPARARLRKVEDPDTVAKRQAKRDRIKQEAAKKPKGVLGLSEELLQNSRSGLRQAPETPLASYLNNTKEAGRSIQDDTRTMESNLEKEIKSNNHSTDENEKKQLNDTEHANAKKCVIS